VTEGAPAASLRAADLARYLCVLHAPANSRDALVALTSFNVMLGSVRLQASEPLLAQMRLTWWHETVEQLYRGQVRAHENVQALALAQVPLHVPQSLLHQMIDAREAECSGTPPATLEDTEAIARGGGGALAQAMCHAIGPAPDEATLHAASQSGTAFTLAAMAASVMVHWQQGWRFVPDALLAASGLPIHHPLPEVPDARWKPAIAALARRAAALAEPALAPDTRFVSVLALRVLARDLLARLARAQHDPRKSLAAHYGALAQLRLLMAVRGKRC
jgi:phytoene/squalene synthetase